MSPPSCDHPGATEEAEWSNGQPRGERSFASRSAAEQRTHLGKTSCLSFSFPGRVLLFQTPKLKQANRHVCLALLEVPLTGHGKSETFCWVALPSQCACVPPKIRGLGTVSCAYTSLASTIDLWEKMARKKPKQLNSVLLHQLK